MKLWILLTGFLTGCVSATSDPSPLSVERPIRIAVCDELSEGNHCQFEDFGQYDVGLKDGEFFVSAENLEAFGARQVVFRVHALKDIDAEELTKEDLGLAVLTSQAYTMKKGDLKVTHTFQVKNHEMIEGKSYIIVADYGGAEAFAYVGVDGAFKVQLTPAQ